MNEIDTLPLPEALQRLLRMVVMGRRDAAEKLAELLAERLEPAAPPVFAVELPVVELGQLEPAKPGKRTK